jgi:transcriptional regulator
MYNISYFKEKDKVVLMQFMRQHDFIVLCGTDADGCPVATQLPVLIREEGEKIFLEGHFMRNTDHHKAFEKNQNVLAMFVGPHTYVSASWYEDPRQASTWNYMTVHAKGRIRFGTEEELLGVLQKTTDHYEGTSVSYQNLEQDYIDKLKHAIVHFEIEVNELKHVFKLSQNRSVADQQAIIEHLEQGDELARMVAKEMKLRLPG